MEAEQESMDQLFVSPNQKNPRDEKVDDIESVSSHDRIKKDKSPEILPEASPYSRNNKQKGKNA